MKLERPAISGAVYGVVLNDCASIERMGERLREAPYKGLPKAPVMYLKPANTLAGNGATVNLPAGERSVEVGATVGVVFAHAASRVPKDRVADVIAGYVLVADLSLPHESYYRPAIREKCFDGACPVAAKIIPADEVGDLDMVVLRTYVDGDLVQTRHLSNLVRDVPTLVAEVSGFMTLRRGDTLLVGVPWCAAQVGTGSTVRVEADRLGSVRFAVVSAQEEGA